jgi:phospholipid-binding lipoprotein MlaA
MMRIRYDKRKRWRREPLLAALLVLGMGAAGAARANEPADEIAAAEAPAEPSSAAAAVDDGADSSQDPWEDFNRSIFRFNDALSRTVAEPVSRAWRFAVPDVARTGMRNFFVNIAFPIRVLNTTLQAKPIATGQEVFRFAINSTFGLAGLVDVATHGWNMPLHREDFGQTLGYWGVGQGPYFMLPFFGPSTVRDTFGLAVDVTTGALTFSAIGVSVPFFATFAAQAGNYINSQSFVVDAVDRERENALDFYAAVRSAYLQFRQARVEDTDVEDAPADTEDDLYYFEDDEPLDAQEAP